MEKKEPAKSIRKGLALMPVKGDQCNLLQLAPRSEAEGSLYSVLCKPGHLLGAIRPFHWPEWRIVEAVHGPDDLCLHQMQYCLFILLKMHFGVGESCLSHRGSPTLPVCIGNWAHTSLQATNRVPWSFLSLQDQSWRHSGPGGVPSLRTLQDFCSASNCLQRTSNISLGH